MKPTTSKRPNRWHAKTYKAEIGGQKCTFRSRVEYWIAQYLQHMTTVQGGEITAWAYEPKGSRFYFPNQRRSPVNYLPDFFVACQAKAADGHLFSGAGEYWEVKRTTIVGRDIEHFRKMKKFHPHIHVVLVMYERPTSEKGINRINRARAYVDRIMYCRTVIDRLRRQGIILDEVPDK